MTREERSGGLAAAARVSRRALLALADDIVEGSAAAVLEAPRAGSVMLEIETAVGEFCLSEVVVTTGRVRVNGEEGWAAVMGFDRAGCLAAAVIDAAGGPAADRLAREALAIETAERRSRRAAVAGTRVALG